MSRSDRSGEAGLSLIELMVAVLLFAVLSGAALYAFTGQSRTSVGQQRANATLENVQASLNALTRQIRMSTGGAFQGWAVLNANANLPAGTTNCGNGVIPTIQVVNSDVAPDEIRIIYPDGATWWGMISDNVTLAGTSVQMRAKDANIPIAGANLPKVNDWAMMTTFQRAVLFKVLSVVACASETCLGKSAASVAAYPAAFGLGNSIYRARWLRYFISNTSFGADLPALMVTDQSTGNSEPGAVGVEDLQVALWIDRDGNGLLQAEDPLNAGADEWVFNAPGEQITDFAVSPTDCALANLRAVRISVVARSIRQDDEGPKLVRPRLEDRSAGVTPDGYYRVVQSTIIGLRNKGTSP